MGHIKAIFKRILLDIGLILLKSHQIAQNYLRNIINVMIFVRFDKLMSQLYPTNCE